MDICIVERFANALLVFVAASTTFIYLKFVNEYYVI